MSKFQLIGLLIMCTALGVTAANFAPPVIDVPTACNYALHFFPIVLLLIGASRLCSGHLGGKVWVNVVIGLTWAFDVFAIVWAIAYPNPNAFGPHNFNDYAPVVLFSVGAITWYLLPSQRGQNQSRQMANTQHQ